MKIDTNPEKIDEILNRGTVVEILPSKKEFKEKLMSGERMTFYIGFDATAPTLHLSHAKNFMLMEKFRQLGHEVIILFGDFTARIGDPTGESTARKQLTGEDVAKNVEKWKEIVKPLMGFDDTENPPQIRYNSTWLSALNFEDVLKLASNLTVQQMIARDMFQQRLEAEQPIYLHEFLYPLMQGYDSVAMNVDVEVCGTDQTFNALVGRTLLKKLNDKEKFVVAVTLMENPVTGELMSKSKGTGVFLDVSANDMYGQVMAQPDEMVKILFTNNTNLSLAEIDSITQSGNPRDAKMRLAFEVVKICHGENAADEAQNTFIETFQKGGVPDDVEEIMPNPTYADALVAAGVVASKTELRRLLEAGGVRDAHSGEKFDTLPDSVTDPLVLKIGKRRFVKLIPN